MEKYHINTLCIKKSDLHNKAQELDEWTLPHLILPGVVKGMWRSRLKVKGVLATAAGGRGAAVAHAWVVPEATFIQVRVSQRLRHRQPLVLHNSQLFSSACQCSLSIIHAMTTK